MTVPRGSASSIPVGIGGCLLGVPAHFGGFGEAHKSVLGELSQVFCWRPLCPELAFRLVMPQAPVLPVDRASRSMYGAGIESELRDDVAKSLRGCGLVALEQNNDLCGYILVQGSPSCNLERVKRYNDDGVVVGSETAGIFAVALRARDPLLPLEEAGRLQDEQLRESFVVRVFTYHAWRQLRRDGLSYASLQTFYAQRKYLLMSHDIATYKQLGKLLATADQGSLAAVAQQVIVLIMAALSRPATRGGYTNTLMHIRGYLKNHLNANEKIELSDLIEQYRQGVIPLAVPLALLRHHFARYPDTYIEQQLFMQPYSFDVATEQ